MVTDIPLINKKNDLRIDGGVSLIPSLYTTVSYGLTDKIAVQGFANIGMTEYLQGAIGRYQNFGKGGVFEWYGGLGYGKADAQNNANPGNLYGDYQLYFTQIKCRAIINR